MTPTNGRVQTEQVEGIVQSVNATGLKIGGAWLNVSNYGPKLELPDAGAHVRLQIDGRGYIKTLDVLDVAQVTARHSGDILRDRQIAKLAVLKAAAEFVGLWGQTREEVK